jgi:hypothetical protein
MAEKLRRFGRVALGPYTRPVARVTNREASAVGGCMLATLLGFVVAACVYDEGDRCDANQRLVNGRHCVCLEGYSMAQGGECIPTSSAAGAACDAENPCDDPVYSHCYDDESNAGYCTTLDCADSSDCAVGFVCVTDTEPSACVRLPEGVGVDCSAQDDCAGFVADYCEVVFAGVCLEAGCDRDDECLGDWICCPAAPVLGQNLCVPEEECILP